MQSMAAMEETAAVMVEVRQGSVVTTKGRRCLGWPGRWRRESMLAPTRASAPEMAETMPGLVVDDEAEVVRGEELSGDLCGGSGGESDGDGILGDGEEVGDDGDGGGVAAGAVAGEDDVSAELAGGDDHVLGAVRPGDGRGERDEHGGDAGAGRDCSPDREPSWARGDLADGAAEFAGVLEVDGGDGAMLWVETCVGVELGVERDAGEDAELGAGVEAVDIGRRVGFGVAGGLGLRERVGCRRRRLPCATG